MSHMPLDTTRIFVHVHPNLQEYPNASLFVEEFEEYKKQAFDYAKENGCLAADFLPALTEEDQKSLPPDQYLFGRDRLFYRGAAANDPLYHVHIFKPDDEKCVWHDDNGISVNQWWCRSDAALIYAHMDTHSNDFHFLLLEIIDPGAHERYEEKGAIEHWRKLVVAYRAVNDI
ncbi:TPA: hypothetical protein JX745_004583 [Escherichia coli]|uniref:type II toxin-antitoxin system YafO family toxin n=1 Tax=Escherichia coli TaxID=562 RepID=UPI000F4EC9F8|nr:type II toxin-antitoxin system YafO family toxin [Escherichia coli]EAZ5417532.1 hypothetical protein [Salmonella enterica]EBU7404529.1 hypothetical protein [Salmonella enterica subsp. enterica serovar Corvallis]ECT5772140.1 hypothetical protein [Salmonella enterica subsp. enterica serovar Worthington]EDB9510467.1 hypothetical protein [Salmonella enterica subsp. enterica serovar Enteritidis]KAB0851622.1 hypothetical protein FZI00_21005 [Cronobacter sakazakii]MCJ5927129.1 type II toxin-antit